MSTTNEYSARYSEVPEIFYDNYTLNLQSKNNKQGRNDSTIDSENELNYKNQIREHEKESFGLYQDLLEEGVAREIARMHLPLNTYTYFYWKIDLHNLFHFLKLRCDSHAQYEIRQYANCLAAMVKEVCPVAFEAWYDYAFAASNWTRLDKMLLNYLINRYGDENYHFSVNNVKMFYENENPQQHKVLGMSNRELEEFWQKLEVPEYTAFTLDNYEVLDVSEAKEQNTL